MNISRLARAQDLHCLLLRGFKVLLELLFLETHLFLGPETDCEQRRLHGAASLYLKNAKHIQSPLTAVKLP